MLRSSLRQVWRFSKTLQIDTHRHLHPQLLLHSYHTKRVTEIDNLADGRYFMTRKAGRRLKTSAWEDKMLACLMIYKEKMNNVLVPQAFVVPWGDLSWPESLWGYRLGRAMNCTRKWFKHQSSRQYLSVQMIEELDKIGFVQDVTQYKWDTEVLPCLRQFEKLYGHSDVPRHFVVPEGDEAWPKAAWGRKLGLTVVDMRAGKVFAYQMVNSERDLAEIRFCSTSIAERDWTEKILPALKVHRNEFGHCVVKQDFKIPFCHPWPTNVWGMPLGQIVRDIRLKKGYVKQAARDKDILSAINFAWYRSEAVWIEQVIPAIKEYAKIFENGNIRRNFVVPSKSPWPKRAWAMKLGRVLGEVRATGTYFRYFGRDAILLDALGFSLQLSSRAWQNRVVPLLNIYERHYAGKKEISDDFIIPSEPPWPKEAWGVRLGLIVARNISDAIPTNDFAK